MYCTVLRLFALCWTGPNYTIISNTEPLRFIINIPLHCTLTVNISFDITESNIREVNNNFTILETNAAETFVFECTALFQMKNIERRMIWKKNWKEKKGVGRERDGKGKERNGRQRNGEGTGERESKARERKVRQGKAKRRKIVKSNARNGRQKKGWHEGQAQYNNGEVYKSTYRLRALAILRTISG